MKNCSTQNCPKNIGLHELYAVHVPENEYNEPSADKLQLELDNDLVGIFAEKAVYRRKEGVLNY